MTTTDWLTIGSVAVPLLLAFAGWLNAIYRKLSEIVIHIHGIHVFIQETKPELRQHGLSIERLETQVGEHGRRLDQLEHRNGVA